jgi:protein NEDD1
MSTQTGTVIGSSSSDGIKTFVVSPSNSTITGRSELRGGTGGQAECVRFNHNGQVLVGAGKSGVITLWHTNGTVLGELSRNQDVGKTIKAMSFSSGSRYLATGGIDTVVKIWDLKRREVIRSFKSHTTGVECVQFSKDADKYVASGDHNGTICLFNVLTGKLLSKLKVSPSGVQSISFTPQDKALLSSAYEDGSVHIWDINTSSITSKFSHAHGGTATGVCFLPSSSSQLISVGYDKKINLYDARSKEISHSLKADSPLSCCEYFADGSDRVVVGTTRGELLIYDVRNMEVRRHPLSRITAHGQAAVTSVQVQPTSSTSSSKASENSTRDNSGNIRGSTRHSRNNVDDDTGSVRSERSMDGVSSRAASDNDPKKHPLAVSSVPKSVSIFPKEDKKTPQKVITAASSSSSIMYNNQPPRSVANDIVPTAPVTNTTPTKSPLSSPPVSSPAPPVVPTAEPILSAPPPASINLPSSPSTDIALNEATSLEEQIRTLLADTKGKGSDQHKQKTTAKEGEDTASTATTDTANATSTVDNNNMEPIIVQRTNAKNATKDEEKSDTTTYVVPSKKIIGESSSYSKATVSLPMTRETRNILREMMEDVMIEQQSTIKSDIQNVHIELLRQFQLQIDEIRGVLNEYTDKFSDLVKENQQLRKENHLLKNIF